MKTVDQGAFAAGAPSSTGADAERGVLRYLEWDWIAALLQRLDARWNRPAVGQALAWILFGAVAAATFAAKGVVAKLTVHDLFFVFDGIWRIYSGQLPYRDFHSPIGAAYFLPFMALHAIEPFSLKTFLHANLLVGGALLLLMSFVLRRRFSPILYVIAAIGPVAVAVSPRATDKGIRLFSLLAPYNRWSEAATMVIALVALASWRPKAGTSLPRSSAARLDGAAAVVLSLLLLFVFHVKISYFVVGVGLLAVGAAYGSLSWRSAIAAVSIFALADAALELLFHFHRAYFADLRMAAVAAAAADSDSEPVKSVESGLEMVVRFGVASALLLFLASYEGDLRAWWKAQRRTFAMAVAALVVAFVGNTQNHWQTEIPLMCSVLLVVAETARRTWVPSRRRNFRGLAFALVVVVGSKAIPTKEVGAVFAHTLESRGEGVCALPGWLGTPGEQLLFPKVVLVAPGAYQPYRCDEVAVDLNNVDVQMGPSELDYSKEARVEAARLTAARELLGPKVAPDESIMAFDFTNPYSAFTGSRPPRGTQLWWHYGRNYSRADKPDPEVFLGDADKVLVSRFDSLGDPNGGSMTRVYGPDLIKRFRPVAQNRLWQLWERRVPRRP